MSVIRNTIAAAAFVACSFSVGCGSDPNVAEVSGTIIFDGKPVENGQISFFPVNGKGVTSGSYIEKGAYKAQVSMGEIQVKINAPKIVGKRKLYPNDPKSAEIETAVEGLPARYNANSELKFDVKERVVKKDFDLKK